MGKQCYPPLAIQGKKIRKFRITQSIFNTTSVKQLIRVVIDSMSLDL